MIDFNNDWDEPDVWSTPTHSPLPIVHPSHPDHPTSQNQLHASSSTSAATSPVSSNESFHPVQSHVPEDLPDSDPGSRTPVAHKPSADIQASLQSPKFTLTSELGTSSIQPKFSPPPLAASSWSSSFQNLSNVDSISSQDLFTSGSSSSFDSSMGFEEFHSHSSYDAQEDANDEDEFGDFDDGEVTAGDDNFPDFTTTSPFPPVLRSTPIVPVKLPDDQFTEKALRAALGPPLEALFENFPSHPDSSQAWLEEPIQLSQKKKNEHPSSRSAQMPSILRSDDLKSTWRTLVNDGNKLVRPIEWKRSQIRRLHLVHLGIPVDLNDFLAPAPVARKSLAIDTKSLTSNMSGKHIRQSPTVASPFKGPMLDRKRCEELAGLSEANLSKKDVEQLNAICDELKTLNQQASLTLARKQQQRDRSIKDCHAYNTMISDLVLAAQKIQMASPGSTKRASSINLGSSSISSSSTRWIPLSRSNSHHHSNSIANIAPQPSSNETAGTSSMAPPPDPSSSVSS